MEWKNGLRLASPRHFVSVGGVHCIAKVPIQYKHKPPSTFVFRRPGIHSAAVLVVRFSSVVGRSRSVECALSSPVVFFHIRNFFYRRRRVLKDFLLKNHESWEDSVQVPNLVKNIN